MRKEICVLMTLVLAVSMISLVSAGVGYPYFEKNTFVMAPGESRDLTFTLSNSEVDSKLFQASVTRGSEIASFAKSKYTVATGKIVNADLRIKIPSTAVDGQEYPFTVNFAEGPADSVQSGISLGVAAEIGFKVVVKKPEVESTAMTPQQKWMIAGIAIVILAIIIWLSLGKKKKRK
ncbi:MAG: hypothetical protein KKE23_02480 [Nanoarchaeota archaeon]|nr:hypothetical protein [Nanoarchaeota archaeon]